MAAQADQAGDAVQQGGGAEADQKRLHQHPDAPPQQHGCQPEEPRFCVGNAPAHGVGQIHPFQREQGQHQHPEQAQQEHGGQHGPVEREPGGLCPDEPQKIFRHGQLGDPAGSQEQIHAGDEQGAVQQDAPVPGAQGVAEVPQRLEKQVPGPQSFAPAGQLKPVEEQGKLVQVPERRQQRDEYDPAQDRGRCEDLVGVAVGQVVHRCGPERQRPEPLQSGHKDLIGQDLVDH